MVAQREPTLAASYRETFPPAASARPAHDASCMRPHCIVCCTALGAMGLTAVAQGRAESALRPTYKAVLTWGPLLGRLALAGVIGVIEGSGSSTAAVAVHPAPCIG